MVHKPLELGSYRHINCSDATTTDVDSNLSCSPQSGHCAAECCPRRVWVNALKALVFGGFVDKLEGGARGLTLCASLPTVKNNSTLDVVQLAFSQVYARRTLFRGEQGHAPGEVNVYRQRCAFGCEVWGGGRGVPGQEPGSKSAA
jgi:hypothetical protein